MTRTAVLRVSSSLIDESPDTQNRVSGVNAVWRLRPGEHRIPGQGSLTGVYQDLSAQMQKMLLDAGRLRGVIPQQHFRDNTPIKCSSAKTYCRKTSRFTISSNHNQLEHLVRRQRGSAATAVVTRKPRSLPNCKSRSP
jgi:hypothetical protein